MIARLIESHPIAPEVKHFIFEVPEVTEFPFRAGQFVSFTHEFGGKKITRAYSTASAPSGNRFELCLNRVHEGRFSPFLFDLQPGDTVEFRGPVGQFVWRNPVSDSILVATGTGIAPFRAMLQEMLPRESETVFTLIFGVRHDHSLLYRNEFEALAQAHRNFRFLPTVTRPGPDWNGRTGRVQPLLLETIGDRNDLDVYICGLKEMVDSVKALLKERGFDKKQIIAEKYD